jgi:hypothetical protein
MISVFAKNDLLLSMMATLAGDQANPATVLRRWRRTKSPGRCGIALAAR